MGYVDDAFENLRSKLEVTQTEQDFAVAKHHQIRDHISQKWELDDNFLTGSYRRHTKTRRLRDVDIFVELAASGAQSGLRDDPPSSVLKDLQGVLEEKYDDVTVDGFACTIAFGAEDDVASFDVVPAFKRKGGGWEIPDVARSTWISTNPKRHHELSSDMNTRCDGKFVPFVKMIKAINREAGDPISTSFLLEIMAQGLVLPPFGRYQDEIVWFLASAAEQIVDDWDDPAGLGPAVNGTMTAAQRQQAAAVLREWQAIAEEAVRLEDDGQERAAVEEWRRLFYNRMPRPSS
jgi:predicted nucleotidyltransferase